MKTQLPHDRNAQAYDFVQNYFYGRLYDDFNKATLSTLVKLVPQRAVICDYGAGTGRVAIPLAQRSFQVHAIERSNPMADQLEKNAIAANVSIHTHRCSISEYQGEVADFALAVFTVLAYLLSEEELKESLRNIRKYLKRGGGLMFDLPSKVLFEGAIPTATTNEKITKTVSLTHQGDQIYKYYEKLSGQMKPGISEYEESFKIRQWQMEEIHQMLTEVGFEATNQPFHQFDRFGSTYFLYRAI